MGKDKGESVMRRSVVVVWLCLALTALSVAAAAPRPQGAGEDTAVAAESGATAVHLAVEDERPLRVALLPLIDRTGGWLSRRMADELTERLEAELRLPLNDVMQWVVYVPEDEGETARDEMLRAAGKKAKLETILPELAENLEADLVVCLEISSCYERRFFRWNGEMGIETVAALTLYGYDARKGREICEPAARFAYDDYHPSREADVLLLEALDEALRRAAFRAELMTAVRRP